MNKMYQPSDYLKKMMRFVMPLKFDKHEFVKQFIEKYSTKELAIFSDYNKNTVDYPIGNETIRSHLALLFSPKNIIKVKHLGENVTVVLVADISNFNELYTEYLSKYIISGISVEPYLMLFNKVFITMNILNRYDDELSHKNIYMDDNFYYFTSVSYIVKRLYDILERIIAGSKIKTPEFIRELVHQDSEFMNATRKLDLMYMSDSG